MTLKSNLSKIAAGLPGATDRGVEATARAVKATRDDLVHVVTGALKASGAVVKEDEGRWRVSEGEGLPDARASFEEFGTRTHGPHPHMIPAAEQHRRALPANVAKEIGDLIRSNKV